MKPLPEYNIHSTGNMKVENIWLELSKKSTKYIICGIYRHPNHAVTEFICELDKVLTNVSSHNTPCLIAGDINVDLTKCKVNNHTAEYIHQQAK